MRVPKLALVVLAAAACGGGDDDRSRGDRLASERRWKEAVEAYERAIDHYPHDYDAAWGIAKIYCFEVHLPKKCLAWTGKLLDAYPERSDFRRAAAQGWRDVAAAARAAGDATAAENAEREAKRYE